MRIAINCRSFLKKNYAGIGRYAYNLVKWLSKIDQKNEYLLYSKKGLFDTKRVLPKFDASNFTVKRDMFSSGPTETLGAVDIYHSPSPDFLNVDCDKIIVTVHDLIYKTFPSGHTPETIATTEKQFEEIINKARKIICVSYNTARDLMRFYTVYQSKITVIHQGVDRNIFYSLDDQQRKEAFNALESKGINAPFILFVGTIEPRKNLKNAIKAFSVLKSRKKYSGKLVVAGMKGWMQENTGDLIRHYGLQDDILFLGYVTDDELRHLYNCAQVFVFPSFYEGFGFPIIEALSCGAAVVTSDTSSCAEVAGDAASLVDPNDPYMIADAIYNILSHKALEKTLRQMGIARAQDFTFEKTARETLKVYEEVYRS